MRWKKKRPKRLLWSPLDLIGVLKKTPIVQTTEQEDRGTEGRSVGDKGSSAREKPDPSTRWTLPPQVKTLAGLVQTSLTSDLLMQSISRTSLLKYNVKFFRPYPRFPFAPPPPPLLPPPLPSSLTFSSPLHLLLFLFYFCFIRILSSFFSINT